MDCVDCDQTSRRRLSPFLTRILNNVDRLCLAVCHALLSSDRLARHEAKSPSAPRRLRPSRLHSSALVGGCEVHAARVAARDLQLQLRLEVHPPGRSRGRSPVVRRLAVGERQHAAHIQRCRFVPRHHRPQRRRSRHVQGHQLVPQALQAARRGRGLQGLHRVRGHAPGRRHLSEWPACWSVRERSHRIRRGHHLRRSLRRPGERNRGARGQHHQLPGARHQHGLPMERQRLQPRLRRHQPPRMAAPDGQYLPDAAALPEPGHDGDLHLLLQLQHCRA